MTQTKSFLKEIDFTKQELEELIDLSIKFKQLKKNRIPHKYLDSLNIALIFEKTSTRTRSAFTVAGQDLGMNVTYLGAGDIQLGKKESVVDTAKVLGSMESSTVVLNKRMLRTWLSTLVFRFGTV